ncbi:MAG: M48 family metalloprotease [Spirochaetales bacterium]|nr:M48 family metalloprotease [Spirochaetales bacterium]
MMRVVLVILAVTVAMTAGSCISIEDISISDIKQVADTAGKIQKSMEDFTPEQEYYIGRAVGAMVLDQYKPYRNKKATDYINLLGQTLALFSERPELFGGYHFLILDSDEINAFATPSGLVFVTRGLLRLARSEDGVAAILAHEIGHIVKKHGLQSIKQARITEALTSAAITAADTAGYEEVAALTETFSASIDDIAKTLIVNGYSREFELQADAMAVQILAEVGYDPEALIELLEALDAGYKPGGLDFAKTHPNPRKRIDGVKKAMKDYRPVSRGDASGREKRFRAFIKEI